MDAYSHDMSLVHPGRQAELLAPDFRLSLHGHDSFRAFKAFRSGARPVT